METIKGFISINAMGVVEDGRYINYMKSCIQRIVWLKYIDNEPCLNVTAGLFSILHWAILGTPLKGDEIEALDILRKCIMIPLIINIVLCV